MTLNTINSVHDIVDLGTTFTFEPLSKVQTVNEIPGMKKVKVEWGVDLLFLRLLFFN